MEYKYILLTVIICCILNSCLESKENDIELRVTKELYENGNLKFINLKDSDGLIEGKSYIFNKSGEKTAEIDLKKGLKNGKFIAFDKGRIASLENYVNNQLEGDVKYYINGFLDQEGQYVDGLKSGIWNYYVDNKLILSEVYNEDSLIEVVYKDLEHYKRVKEKIPSFDLFKNNIE